MFNNKLVKHWFYNVINNKRNDEILLLVLSNLDYQRKKFKESFDKLQIKNCELIEITSIKSINEIKKNKNIIILGHPMMNIDLLNNLHHCVLYSLLENLDNNFFTDDGIKITKTHTEKKLILGENRYIHFYEKGDPIMLLNPGNNYKILGDIITLPIRYRNFPFNFITQIFSDGSKYTYSSRGHFCNYEDIILRDYIYLCKSNNLTTRLAIYIYKVTTLKLDESTTKIGIYYSDKLGVKSRTVRLPKNIYMSPGNIVKAYDLTNYFGSVKS